MAIKKVLLSKKIDNVIYDIFPKTSAEVVVYGESTVAATLAQFAKDLADVYTKTETDGAIKASADALYNKIMGITDEDGTTVTEAYDTLKEVAAWINEHGDVAAAFTTDIAALKAAVGDAESGLVKAMADAQAAITALQETTEDHETRIADLEAVVGDEESGLVKDVATLKAASGNHTEASEVNGNIKVDGEEVVVYTHPETHPASMIVEDDDHNFVTTAEKEAISKAAEVLLVSSQDEVVNEKDLYMVEITD